MKTLRTKMMCMALALSVPALALTQAGWDAEADAPGYDVPRCDATALSMPPFTYRRITDPCSASAHAAIGDIDGDGDTDFAVSRYSHVTPMLAPVWFEQTGPVSFVAHPLPLTLSKTHGIAVGDMDGDGDQDIITAETDAADGNNRVVVFHNQGGGTFSADTIATSTRWTSWIVPCDIDGDGKRDLVVAADGVNILRNMGGGVYSRIDIDLSLSGNRILRVVDLDRDGRMDIVGSDQMGGNVFWYRGTGAFGFVRTAIASYPALRYVSVGDMDNDGDLDLVCASYSGSPSVYAFENVGGCSFAFRGIDSIGDVGGAPDIVDIDRDGRLDFATLSEAAGYQYLYYNTGKFAFARCYLTNSSWSVCLRALDADNDGDTDFLFASNAESEMGVWQQVGETAPSNTYPRVSVQPALQAVVVGSTATVAIAASDPDGAPLTYQFRDLPSGARVSADNATVTWTPTVVQTGVHSFTVTVTDGGTPPLSASATATITVRSQTVVRDTRFVYRPVDEACEGAYNIGRGDLDGDGDEDLVIGRWMASGADTRPARWYERTGPFTYIPHDLPMALNAMDTVAVADFDGDGDLDICCSQEFDPGTIVLFRNDGSGVFVASVVGAFGRGAYQLKVADLDRANGPDILCAYEQGVSWLRNSGTGTFAKIDIDATLSGTRSVQAVDVDGDGDLDVVAPDYGGGILYWYRNDGAASFVRAQLATCNGLMRVTMGDVDADGDLDAVGVSISVPSPVLFENIGSLSFTVRSLDALTGPAAAPVLADINDDGLPDIVGSRNINEQIWYEQTPDHTFVAHSLTNFQCSYAMCPTDIDGDGDLDIIATDVFAHKLGIWEQIGGTVPPTSNCPPVVSVSPAQQQVTVGQTAQAAITYRDPEGMPVSVAVQGLPAGATLNADKTLLTWTPTAGQTSTVVITFVVTDGGTPPLSASATATINVVPAGSGGWTNIARAAAWSPRKASELLAHRTELWMMGGMDGSRQHRDVWKSVDGANWSQVCAAAPWTERNGFGAVVFNERMWVMGGYDGYTPMRGDVWSSADGTNWSCATAAAAWSARCDLGTVVHGGRIWVIGGLHQQPHTPCNDAWSSADGTNWTCATSAAPWTPRYSHAVASFNGRLYVMGGYDGSWRNDVWSSADGATWRLETANAPWSPRFRQRAVVWNNKLVLVGGSYSDATCFNDAWATIDGTNWSCMTATAEWSQRYSERITVHNEAIWLVGGYAGGTYFNDVWRYGAVTVPPRTNCPPVVVVTPVQQRVTVGQTVQASIAYRDPEGAPVTVVAQNVPAGAAINADRTLLTWTPAAGQTGTTVITFIATDSGVPPLSASATATINVVPVAPPPPPPPPPPPTNIAPYIVATPASQRVAVGGVAQVQVAYGDRDSSNATVRAEGVPAGAVLSADMRQMTWMPRRDAAPTNRVEFTVTDGGVPPLSAMAVATIIVLPEPPPPPPALEIVTREMPAGTEGTPYRAPLVASGGVPPYAWSLAGGALPRGLAIGAAGVVEGMPLATGTFVFTAQVADQAGTTASRTLAVTIAGAPDGLRIVTEVLPDSVLGHEYNTKVLAEGGQRPYRWSIVEGALPPDLILNDESGLIYGKPQVVTNIAFVMQVTDKDGATAVRELTLNVFGPELTRSAQQAQGGVTYAQFMVNWRRHQAGMHNVDTLWLRLRVKVDDRFICRPDMPMKAVMGTYAMEAGTWTVSAKGHHAEWRSANYRADVEAGTRMTMRVRQTAEGRMCELRIVAHRADLGTSLDAANETIANGRLLEPVQLFLDGKCAGATLRMRYDAEKGARGRGVYPPLLERKERPAEPLRLH